MPPVAMRVWLYVPSKLYGFCEDESGGQVFFHLSAFAMAPGEPPPILGEPVDVEVLASSAGKVKARAVRRTSPPRVLSGVVKSFSAKDGWGFVTGSDRTDYYVHRSDVVDEHILVRGQTVKFCAGHKRGRPRACYVRV